MLLVTVVLVELGRNPLVVERLEDDDVVPSTLRCVFTSCEEYPLLVVVFGNERVPNELPLVVFVLIVLSFEERVEAVSVLLVPPNERVERVLLLNPFL